MWTRHVFDFWWQTCGIFPKRQEAHQKNRSGYFNLVTWNAWNPTPKQGSWSSSGRSCYFCPFKFWKKQESSNFVVLLVTINVINVHTLPWNWPTPRFMNVTSLSRSADSVESISWKKIVHGKLQGTNLSHKSFATTCHHLTVFREAYGSPWGASNIASSISAWLDGVRTRRESLRNQLRRRGRTGDVHSVCHY